MTKKTYKILIIEDNLGDVRLVQEMLDEIQNESFALEHAGSLSAGLKRLNEGEQDVVLLDLSLPDSHGLKTFTTLQSRLPRIPFVVLSGLTDEAVALEALKNGAQDYLIKGQVDGNLLVRTVRYAIERKRIELALQESERRHRRLVEIMPDVIYMLGKEGNFVFVNEAIRYLGYEPEELIGKHFSELIHPKDVEKISRLKVLPKYTNMITGDKDAPKLFDEKRTGKRKTSSLEVHIKPKQTQEYQVAVMELNRIQGKIVEITASGYYDDDVHRTDKEFLGTIGVIRDITERKKTEEKINFMAYYDPLTSLPNRALFNDRLHQEMSHSRRNKRMLAVMFIDLDRFKVVNDTLGHTAGDQLLKIIAERLKSCLRDCDTVSRLGGDEFAILVPEIGNVEDVAEVTQRILKTMKQVIIIDGHELYVSVSIGIAFYPNDGQTAEVLLKNADTAMYRAKEKGRDNFQLYSAVMHEKAYDQLMVESNLRRAVENCEFVVYYQPQVNIDTGFVVGMEALVRWQHPKKGMVPPSEFIQLAEDTGLISSIDLLVLRMACIQNKTWQDAGLPPVCMAVNISGHTFKHDALIETIDDVLKMTGMTPNLLELEITEGIAIQNLQTTINKLNKLNSMGIQIAIDDFGTGFSSLSYLSKFPIQKLKIGATFITNLTQEPTNVEIVTAIIAMSKGLNLKVIAEAVENENQLEFLRSLKCDEIQGYLFSKAVAATEMEEMLRRNKCLRINRE